MFVTYPNVNDILENVEKVTAAAAPDALLPSLCLK